MTTTHHHQGTAAMPDLRERRQRAGLSQAALAVAADVHLNTVARAEQGLRVLPSVRAALERALELPAAAA